MVPRLHQHHAGDWRPNLSEKSKPQTASLFQVMNEIGIINQLGTTLFAKRMPLPLTMPQFSVLNHLIRVGEGTTPKNIASAFQVPNTSMSHTLGLLQHNGFITYQVNASDRRSKTVWLTDKGRTIHQRAIETLAGELGHLNDILSAKELEALLGSLTRVRQFMDDNR